MTKALASREVEYDQPTAAPTPKVAAVAISGVLATVVVIVLGLLGVEPPPNLEENILALIAGVTALTTLINFVVAYFKRDKKVPEAVAAIEKNPV